jgi:hypothetical protein
MEAKIMHDDVSQDTTKLLIAKVALIYVGT